MHPKQQNLSPFINTDFYKVDHISQYLKETTKVVSNGTCRKSRLEGINRIVFFGLQGFIKEYLIEYFNKNFFALRQDQAIEPVRRLLAGTGCNIKYNHIAELHKLGYLPIEIYALPEGSEVPIRVPMFIIYNTLPQFFWLTNFLETIMSCELWQSFTTATIAKSFRDQFLIDADQTSDIPEFVQWQGHDFSMRGMCGREAAMKSGAGHLLSFTGTDTIPAIAYLEKYYNADVTKELVGASVPATEHSVMCVGAAVIGEYELFEKLITEVYPTGIVSIVSDTWDLWKVLTDYLPRLKDKIMKRDGKVVIRPDSGDPVEILTGKFERLEKMSGFVMSPVESDSPADKGVIQLLYDTFGGTVNSKGYIQLDPHVGAIYGDSITRERAKDINRNLLRRGFASTNWVAGIGSFTYQFQTRDTFGFAMKATYCEVDGKPYEIFKDPVTDDGTKKSLKGLIAVYKTDNGYVAKDQATWNELRNCAFQLVYKDGELLIDEDLSTIRKRLN